MKSLRITSFALAATFVVLSMFSVVLAQEATPTEVTTTATDRAAEREARLAARKAERQERLDAKREEVLIKKCTVAQKKIENFLSRADTATSKHLNVYQRISTKLDGFVDKFEARGAETTDLATALGVLQTMIDDATVNIQTYRDAISDLVNMDCENDPTGFQVTLEEAREAVSAIKSDVAEISNYLKNDIRGLFTTMMNAYNASEAAKTSTSGTDDELEDENEATETEVETEPTEVEDETDEPTEQEGGSGSEDN